MPEPPIKESARREPDPTELFRARESTPPSLPEPVVTREDSTERRPKGSAKSNNWFRIIPMPEDHDSGQVSLTGAGVLFNQDGFQEICIGSFPQVPESSSPLNRHF